MPKIVFLVLIGALFVCAPVCVTGCALRSSSPSSVQGAAAGAEHSAVSAENSEVTQADGEKLGDEKAPIVSSITITWEQVAGELGVPKNKLAEQALVLANFLQKDKLPKGLCDDDDDDSAIDNPETSTEKICSQVESLQNLKVSSSAVQSSGGRRVPIRPHHFEVQQRMGFDRLGKSLRREPAARVLSWVPAMLATTACPRNLSAATLRKMESFLPALETRATLESLYIHVSGCLKPEDSGYELTHLRQALLRHMWGNDAGALEAIRKAVLATDSNEKSRVLYWAGRLESDPLGRKKYWDTLVESYPLSYHALEVWAETAVDPYDIFTKRPALSLGRTVTGDYEEIDQSLRWLEALYLRGHVDAAQKFSRWIASVYKKELSSSNLLYISSLKSNRGTPLNTITFLTRQVNENPVILNQQTLKLLFPLSYFELFEKASPHTDTFFIMSVARQESGFNPKARSSANARGLLQLLPSTARALSGRRKNDLYHTETNANLGVKFLSNLIEKFGSTELALAAYNAGPGRIPEWEERYGTSDPMLFLDLIPFKETRNYVSSIVRNNYWYERLYGGASSVLASRGAGERAVQYSQLVSRLVSSHRETGDATARAPASTEAKAL